MRERGLPCTEESVRGILAGRKTQTRRLVMGAPVDAGFATFTAHHDRPGGSALFFAGPTVYSCGLGTIRCPYGAPGDRLWVRETFWCSNETCDHDYCGGCDLGSLLSLGEGYAQIRYCATPECLAPPPTEKRQTVLPHEGDPVPGDWWLAPPDDWDGTEVDHGERGQWEFCPWRYYTKYPSIHMPRWASRITLEVTGVRVERLQSISEEDAIAEGVELDPTLDYSIAAELPPCVAVRHPHQIAFAGLWDTINAKRAPWASNPWVWVIEFRRVEAAREAA